MLRMGAGGGFVYLLGEAMTDRYIQQNSNSTTGASVATTLSVAASGADVTAGSTVVVIVINGSSTSQPNALTVKDGTTDITALMAAINDTASCWGRSFAVQNSSGGAHTYTAAWSTETDSVYIVAIEVGTDAGASAVSGQNAQHQGGGTAPGTGTDAITSNSANVTGAATLIAYSTDSSNVGATYSPVAGTGFSSQASDNNSVIGSWRLESKAVSSSAAGTFTHGSGDSTGADHYMSWAVAVLNGAAATGGGPLTAGLVEGILTSGRLIA